MSKYNVRTYICFIIIHHLIVGFGIVVQAANVVQEDAELRG